MTIKPEIIDALLSGCETPEDVFGESGVFLELKKAALERMLNGELTAHLGYEKGDEAGRGSGNNRNGHSRKTVQSSEGSVDLSIPRDRNGSFEPQVVAKGQRRIDGFDDKIISLYARGMTVREIRGHLKELYGAEVSPDVISRVTDSVLEEVRTWQTRALDPVYPVVFFDALRVKIRDDGLVRNKAVYVALAVTCDGEREVLGLWVEQTEGAKFWLKVMNELKTRGLSDILIAVVDGLKGFPETIEAVFPETTVQTCIVHLVRHSLRYCTYKDRRAVARDLKVVYRAETSELAQIRLAEFEDSWGEKYPSIAASWRRHWEQVIPFFAFPPDIRRVIYTTNAIESLHMTIRKIIKTRGSFPTDDAAIKLIYLAIRNAGQTVKRNSYNWKTALNQFAIMFGNRLTPSVN